MRILVLGGTGFIGPCVVRRLHADGHQVTIEGRHYYKPGQALVDPNSGASTVNQFESSARIEVVAIAALQR